MKLDFWNRKVKKVYTSLGELSLPPCPPRKEYVAMYELLKSAEYFDNEISREIANKKLKILRDYIDEYLSKDFTPINIPAVPREI